MRLVPQSIFGLYNKKSRDPHERFDQLSLSLTLDTTRERTNFSSQLKKRAERAANRAAERKTDLMCKSTKLRKLYCLYHATT